MSHSHFLTLADVGVPMIMVEWPLMICALIPVVVLEALLIRRWVSLSYRDAFVGTAFGNAVSTVVGVPLAWLLMLAIEFAVGVPTAWAADKWQWELNGPVFQVLGMIVSSAWLGPAGDQLNVMIPAAAALLLIPCFYISVWLERFVCLRVWKSSDPGEVRRGVYRANLASYLALFAFVCILFFWGLKVKTQ